MKTPTNSRFEKADSYQEQNGQAGIESDELLTIAEVAAYLKLSRRTAWRWCKSGRLPAVKIGHQWRISQSDLEAFIRRRGKLIS